MNFSIITPSLNQLEYLKRCVASVADQVAPKELRTADGSRSSAVGSQGAEAPGQRTGSETAEEALNEIPISTCDNLNGFNESGTLSVHHHIQDGGSTDGTVEFLQKFDAELREQQSKVSADLSPLRPVSPLGRKRNGRAFRFGSRGSASAVCPAYTFSYSSERDAGMYDALNKGLARADGDVVAWLNCDEQYLRGTLKKAEVFFRANPFVDILFGGMLMVDSQGKLLACRQAMPMRRYFLEASYLYNYSCAMFVRRSLWEQRGGFDTAYRNAGDEEWVRRAMVSGAKTATLKEYLSAFGYSAGNLSSAEGALEEHEALKRAGSAAGRIFKLPVNLLRLAEKAARGGQIQKTPVEYELYVEELKKRCKFEVAKPSSQWPDMKTPYLMSHRLK